MPQGVFRGFVGFDECVNNRIWTTTQINTLVFLSKILSVFLVKSRSQDTAQILSDNLRSLLDNQNAWIYVIDPETFRLRYLNQRAREISPVVREGAYCYEVLHTRTSCCPDCPARNIQNDGTHESFILNSHLGVYVRAEATGIHWNGKDSCLVTCRQVFQ